MPTTAYSVCVHSLLLFFSLCWKRARARVLQAVLSIGWLRVGYVQGNMNSDNCLISGRTMDYGPFGFIERYTRAAVVLTILTPLPHIAP